MFKGNRYSKRFDGVILQPLLHCVVLPPTSSQIDFSTPSTPSHLQHQQKKLIQPEKEMTNETFEEIPEISSRYVIFDIKGAQPLQNAKKRQKYVFPDFCLILIFKPRTTFSKNLRVKRLVEVL